MGNTLKNTIIIISLISFILYSFEALLTVQNRKYVKSIKINKYLEYKKNNDKEFDKRSYIQIYQDLKKNDPDITFLTKPIPQSVANEASFAGEDIWPLSAGVSNRATILCNESGEYVIYTGDRFGFNNPDTEWDKKKVDFVLLGDSTLQGFCVESENTVTSVLRELNDSDGAVLNLGKAGISSLSQYAILKEYMSSKKTKRILWLYSNRDLEDLDAELKNKILINYLNNKNFTQNIILNKEKSNEILLNEMNRQINYDEKLKTYVNNYYRIFRFATLKKVRNKLFSYSDLFANPNPIDPKFLHTKEFKKILKLSNDFAIQNNAKFYFIYLPHWHRYGAKDIPDETELSFNVKTVFEIVRNLNIPIIDLNKEFFLKQDNPKSFFPFENDGHLTIEGHAGIAKTIFNKIENIENK